MVSHAQVAIVVVILIVIIVAVALYASDRKKKGPTSVGGSASPACPGRTPGIPCAITGQLPKSYQDKASGKTFYDTGMCYPIDAFIYAESGTNGASGAKSLLFSGPWTQMDPGTKTKFGYVAKAY